MGKEFITFGDIKIKKKLQQKSHFFKDVNIKKVLVSNMVSSSEKNYKCFIGYLYDEYKIMPLHTMLPKTRAYVKSYDGHIKWMYFLTEVDN